MTKKLVRRGPPSSPCPTMVAGIYGMNFKNMPELDWSFGYPLALAVMLIGDIWLYLEFQEGEVGFRRLSIARRSCRCLPAGCESRDRHRNHLLAMHGARANPAAASRARSRSRAPASAQPRQRLWLSAPPSASTIRADSAARSAVMFHT